jgi:hypothetical protein
MGEGDEVTKTAGQVRLGEDCGFYFERSRES